MTEIPASENARIQYINHLMDELYESLPLIYESMVENNNQDTLKGIMDLEKILTRIRESMEDES